MPTRRSKNQMVVVFTGEKLSGKELAAQYLVKKHRFVGYRFSKILDDILRRMHFEVSRENEMNLSGALRERFGGGVLAEVIKRDIARHKYRRVAVDGMRDPGENEILSKLPGFILVYLSAPLAVRYQRARKRGEKAGEHRFTLEQFKREEKFVTELYIQRMGRKAKVKIVNDGTVKDFYRKLEGQLVKPFLR